ncbi:hypothetical protein [Methylopila sp. 73B]|uniref:hypothetical protein n=1 Tax=Methylopila sp. 73B TaxID=1120792 RepID=UPI000365E65A|nr:hypothetical protein [Methylopila sp. 73B]
MTDQTETLVEFKIRPIVRYAVTKYEYTSNGGTGKSSQLGVYDNFDTSYEVGVALARGEQQRLGVEPFSMAVVFPSDVQPVVDAARRVAGQA